MTCYTIYDIVIYLLVAVFLLSSCFFRSYFVFGILAVFVLRIGFRNAVAEGGLNIVGGEKYEAV